MTISDGKGQQTRFMLRLPTELDKTLKRDAQNANRSKNGHIVHLLKSTPGNQGNVGGVAGNDLDEQGVLKWFRSLPEIQREAFLILTRPPQE